MNRLLSTIFFILIANKIAFSSVPDVVNFTTKDYNSHSINFCFAQDAEGIMYIGNAYGILEYDGKFWRKIAIDDGKSGLSMDVSDKGIVYVGSSDEFGYLKRDKLGITRYISLKKLLPEKSIDQILNTVCVGDKVYFNSLYSVYCFQNNKIQKVIPQENGKIFYGLNLLGSNLLTFQLGEGAIKIQNSKAKTLNTSLKNTAILGAICLQKDTIYIGENKIISSNSTINFSQLNQLFQEVNISCFLKINEEEFLVGTLAKGIFYLNRKGEIISNLTVKEGLQDNFIHRLFLDKKGDVWAAYNNGIGVIKWNSPVQYISNFLGFEGMGYCGITKGDTLYVGTSRGLYYLPKWKKNLSNLVPFNMVNGIKGTINDLKIHNGKLLACQEAEVYEIKGSQARLLSPGLWFGAWIWNPSSTNKNEAFVGTYLGLARYLYQDNNWKFKTHIKGFKESSRVFEMDKRGVFWVVQGNTGLYRVQLNFAKDSAISVINYAEKAGFSPSDFNDIFSLNDSIFVSTFKGVYYIKKDELVLMTSFSALGNKNGRIRKYSPTGLYSVDEDQPHLLIKNGGKWEVENAPVSFLKSFLVGSAEFFYQIDKNVYLIGTQDGFAIYRPSHQKKQKQIPCLIRKIELLNATGDSLFCNEKPYPNPKFSYENNNIRITYSIPIYGEYNQILYETRLYKSGKPLHNWQVVRQINFKEYTNLKEGKYTFWVRAKKGDAIVGDTTLSFTIKPPWYRTGFSYCIYFLLFVYAFYRVKRLFKEQKVKLEADNKRELEIKEKLYRAEKLEIELKNKDNELAYMALSFTQKKDLMENVMGKLDSFSKDLTHEEQIKLRTVKSALSSNMDDESNWQNFQVHFDQKNNNFFQKLKEKESSLNESYLLFCSYIRMGKSNKEIADLLNISVAAVEKRKYRLKKKWNLADDTSFTEFLRNL